MTRACLFSSLVVAAACAGDDGHHDDTVDCTTVTGADEFVVGLQKTGANGLLDFQLLSAEPSPPARGDNTWTVQVSAMQSGVVGAPIDGATLTATPFMPEHKHGSPLRVNITANGQPGQYTLTPVNLWMPGIWETTIKATSGDSTDTAIYKFCIN